MTRALTLLAAVTLAAPAIGQGMEPGEWRLTSTIQFSDMPKPEVETENKCLTKADVEDVSSWLRDFPECKITTDRKSADGYSWQVSCPKTGMRGSGSMRWTRTTVELDMNLTAADKKEMRSRLSGRRLGPCK
jgi:hypothetical protein